MKHRTLRNWQDRLDHWIAFRRVFRRRRPIWMCYEFQGFLSPPRRVQEICDYLRMQGGHNARH